MISCQSNGKTLRKLIRHKSKKLRVFPSGIKNDILGTYNICQHGIVGGKLQLKIFLLFLYFVPPLFLIDLSFTASMNGREEFIIPASALPFLIMFLYYTVSFMKSYRRVKKLHSCGERTTGKMVDFDGQRSARHARIMYYDADGAGHVCITTGCGVA